MHVPHADAQNAPIYVRIYLSCTVRMAVLPACLRMGGLKRNTASKTSLTPQLFESFSTDCEFRIPQAFLDFTNRLIHMNKINYH